MLAYVFIVIGLATLVLGAELLVRGASRLADAARISPLIIGLTVVAFGTSAPELAVSVTSALASKADIAVGNVVGSNIFNILLILGLSATIAPLAVDPKLIRFDVPLMIAASFLTWWFCSDGLVNRVEGTILFAGILAYTGRCIIIGRRESQATRPAPTSDTQGTSGNGSEATTSGIWTILWQLTLVLSGLVLLVLGATWLIDGATEIARRFKVSELVIGLTIVAAGTSLPELATSLVAALKGDRDIAVGNVIGSNLFNLLGVLGLTAIVAPNEIPVATQALEFDIQVMVAVAVACLPIFFTGHLIARWEGGLLLGYFVAYTILLVLMAEDNDLLPVLQQLIFRFAIPLTVVTLTISLARCSFRKEPT